MKRAAAVRTYSRDIVAHFRTVGLLLRGDATPKLDKAISLLEQKGIEVVRHPKAAGKPLKFGMCGAFDAPEE